jgi:hypothetical protein
MSRLHSELFARELECTRQAFADKAPHQCALDVESKGVGALVDFHMCQRRPGSRPANTVQAQQGLCLRVTFHDLDRHVGVACVDKQPSRVGPVNFEAQRIGLRWTDAQKRGRTLLRDVARNSNPADSNANTPGSGVVTGKWL